MFFARLIWRHFLAGSLSQNVVSTLVRRGWHPSSPQFVACQTRVESDLNIVWPGLDGGIEKQAFHQHAELCMVQQMTPRIHRIQLTLESGMSWNPGQFAKLLPLDLADDPRCYSMVTSG